MLAALALASSLMWGTADFFGGKVSQARNAIAVVGVSQAIGFVLVSGAVLWQAVVAGAGSALVAGAGWGGWLPWSALAGACGLSGLLCFYTALASGTMGVVAPIASMGVVVPVVLGVAGGETPSPWVWIGMLTAIIGLTMASGPELSGDVSPRPVILAVVAAFCFGLALFALDRGSRTSTLMTLWGMRATSVLVFGTMLLALRRLGGITVADLPMLTFIGGADLAANALFGLASSGGDVSVASVLGSLYPVVTILLARVVLGERLRGVQQAGVALSVLGAAIVSLR